MTRGRTKGALPGWPSPAWSPYLGLGERQGARMSQLRRSLEHCEQGWEGDADWRVWCAGRESAAHPGRTGVSVPLRAASQRDPISAGGPGGGGACFCLGLSSDAPSPPATKWPSNQPPEGMVRAHFLVPLRRGLPRPWGCPVFHSSPESPRTIGHSAGGHVSSVFQVELRGEGA